MKTLIKNVIAFFLGKKGLQVNVIKYSTEVDFEQYRFFYSKEALDKKCFFNIGAGNFSHPYWTNIDCPSDWYSSAQKDKVDLSWDAMSLGPLPVPDDTANIVYSSHTIEHISDAAVKNMFKESYRILKKGGVLRVTCPDISLFYRAYLDNDPYISINAYDGDNRFKCDPRKISKHRLFLSNFASQLAGLTRHVDKNISDEEIEKMFKTTSLNEALDHFTHRCDLSQQNQYPGEHVNWWTDDKLLSFFKDAGFSLVYKSGYAQSKCAVLRHTFYFDSTHPKISLYVEAVKT